LAEELAQDVFLQFYEQKPTIESPAHLASWLRRASMHRCIDALRKRGTKEVEMEELPEIAEEPVESDSLRDEKLQKLVASMPGA
jgi:DNA-directed RNA polymerase specialized sigma24 family protein